ncbi:hypothetical protein B0H14DRAFT_2940905, partial [Mycena olivaceomarginata]
MLADVARLYLVCVPVHPSVVSITPRHTTPRSTPEEETQTQNIPPQSKDDTTRPRPRPRQSRSNLVLLLPLALLIIADDEHTRHVVHAPRPTQLCRRPRTHRHQLRLDVHRHRRPLRRSRRRRQRRRRRRLSPRGRLLLHHPAPLPHHPQYPLLLLLPLRHRQLRHQRLALRDVRLEPALLRRERRLEEAFVLLPLLGGAVLVLELVVVEL